MKKIILGMLSLVAFMPIYAQSFFRKIDGKFDTKKITILNALNDKITVKVYYSSSSRCQCAEDETIEVQKNSAGQFVHAINNDMSNIMTINMKDNKVSSINVVNSIDYDCCSILSGKYFPKTPVIANKVVSANKIQNKNIKANEIVIEIPDGIGSFRGIMIALNSNLDPASWKEASLKCDSLKFGATPGGYVAKYNDWTLPTKEQLCVIYDYFKKNPDYFKTGKEYWSRDASSRRAGFYISTQFWSMDLPCQPTQNSGETKLEIMPVRLYDNTGD